MMVERRRAEAVQLEAYDNPSDDRAFGEGLMQEALIHFRCQTALAVLKKYQVEKEGFVLDAGCGQGEVTKVLIGAGWRAIGLDLAARRLADTSKGQRGDWLAARAQELPFTDGSIGAIFAYEIFEHLLPEDGKKMLEEFHRVLTSEGILVLSTPNTLSLAGRMKAYLGEGDNSFLFRPDHFNEVNFEEIQAAVAKAGLEIIEVKGIGLIPGMWRVQRFFPSRRIQEANIKLGSRVPQVASETLVIAKRLATL